MKAVFDTNILIDYLNGIPEARDEIGAAENPLISIITWMEVLVGTRAPDDERRVRGFLNTFTLVALDADVSERAIVLRRENRMRLPDAIIWATAKTQETLLITRNIKDFSADRLDVRIPYHL